MIPLSVPSIQNNEWRYVKECLDTEWVSSAGKYVNLFESKIAQYTGSKYAVACMNGTSALQVALRLAGVKPGHEVIVPALTFIAPVNVIRYLNANPVFMDSDKYYNLDIKKTIEFIQNKTIYENGITINKSTHNRITAVIPVHVFGNAVDLEALLTICDERNIKIVEDASESLGTVYSRGKLKGKHCGAIGKLGCLSFNGNKIITTGGGGMILCDDAEVADKALYLTTQAKDDPLRYIHNEIGYNFRMTNIQAAMGVAQLEQLPKYLKKKKDIYQLYKKKIEVIPGLRVADVPSYAANNHWLTSIQIDEDKFGKNREELMMYLSENNIQARPVWFLNHQQKPYQEYSTYKIKNAPELWKRTLNIPSSVNISEEQINTVVKTLSNA